MGAATRPTRLTARLRAGDVLGVLSGRVDPELVEESAHAGFDFYVIDLEHTSASDRELAGCVRAGDSGGIPVLVRLGHQDLPRLAHFLDAGGDGAILAHVTSRQDLATLIDICCYPPIGSRGVGTTRVARYGFEPTAPAWLADQNDGLFLGALIETELPVDVADRIASDARLSAVFIGARDLSVALGVAGDMTHPQVLAATNTIRTACERHGVPVAVMVRDLDGAPRARLRMVGIGTMMSAAVRALRR